MLNMTIINLNSCCTVSVACNKTDKMYTDKYFQYHLWYLVVPINDCQGRLR